MVLYFYSRHTCVLQKGVCMLVHGNIFLQSPYVGVAEGCVYVSAW